MFEPPLFRSWTAVLAGAVCFAGLFGVAVWMGEQLFEDAAQVLGPSRTVLGLSAAAFVGFLAVAAALRYTSAAEPPG